MGLWNDIVRRGTTGTDRKEEKIAFCDEWERYNRALEEAVTYSCRTAKCRVDVENAMWSYRYDPRSCG